MEIVVGNDASSLVQLAASELQYYLNKIYDTKVRISTKLSGGSQFVYYIGHNGLTDVLGDLDTGGLQDGAFLLHGTDSLLVLLGDDKEFIPREPCALFPAQVEAKADLWDAMTGHDWVSPYHSIYRHYNRDLDLWEFDHDGTLQAVYTYLRLLGVRWYLPGSIGEVLPKEKIDPRIVIDTILKPHFPVRNHYHYFNNFFMATKQEILFRYRQGLNSGSNMLGYGPPGHGIDNILHSKKLKNEHPEYYAEYNGRRVTDGSRMFPCLSAQGLVDEAVLYLQSVFEIYEAPTASIMPPDGFGSACQCENCEKLITPERGETGKYSDYVWSFVDQVAQKLLVKYPNKKIICFAYSTYLLPPEKVERLSPNIRLGICRRRSSVGVSEKLRAEEDLIKIWKEKIGNEKIIFWDYYLTSRPSDKYFSVPVVFPHLIRDDIRRNSDVTYGDFIEVYRMRDEQSPFSIATNHINLYVTSRLYWDPFLNLDSLLEDYYHSFYGPAANEIKRFIEISERQWSVLSSDAVIIDSLFYHLNKAFEKVVQGTLHWERIKLIEAYVHPLKELSNLASRKRSLAGRLRFVHGDPTLLDNEGFPTEAFWSSHHSYSLTGDQENTIIQVAHTAEGLYCHITCHETQMDGIVVSGKSTDDRRILAGENVELLFETTLHSFYQFVINPTGLVFDSDQGAGSHINWNSQIRHRVHKTMSSWVIDLMIPADEIGNKPSDNILGRIPSETFPWYFNIRRNRVNKTGESKSYFRSVSEDQFYIPETFVRFYKR